MSLINRIFILVLFPITLLTIHQLNGTQLFEKGKKASFEAIKNYSESVPVFQLIVGERRTGSASPKKLLDAPTFLNTIPAPGVALPIVRRILQKGTKRLLLAQENHQFSNSSEQFFEKAQLFNQNSILHIIGDQHASFHDTVNFMQYAYRSDDTIATNIFIENKLRLKPEYKNHHWIFAGDLTDRGTYGIETLLLIIALYLVNPNNIHIIRGNHEDIAINETYGLRDELNKKYGKDEAAELFKLLAQFYSKHPVALWTGFKVDAEKYQWKLICHGGLEKSETNMNAFFDQTIKNKIAFKMVPSAYNQHIGYMWNDFTTSPEDKITTHGGRTAFNENYVKQWAGKHSSKKHSITDIIRSHQHQLGNDGLMPQFFQNSGISQLWKPRQDQQKNRLWQKLKRYLGLGRQSCPIVTTLCVQPCTSFGIPYGYADGQDSYPAVIYTTIAVLEKNGTSLQFMQLPNMHVPEWVKTIHARRVRANIGKWEDNSQIDRIMQSVEKNLYIETPRIITPTEF